MEASAAHDCPVCYNTYNDAERFPHVLGCGHSYCLACLTHLLGKPAGTRLCPICKERIAAESPSKVTRNYQLIPSHRSADGAPAGPVGQDSRSTNHHQTRAAGASPPGSSRAAAADTPAAAAAAAAPAAGAGAGGAAQVDRDAAGSALVCWEQLEFITDSGKIELSAAGLTPASGLALQALGYTEPGDLRYIADQLAGLYLSLPPNQASKLRQLVDCGGGGGSGGGSSGGNGSGGTGGPSGSAPQGVVPVVPQHTLLPASIFNAVEGHELSPDKDQVWLLCDGCGGVRGLAALLSAAVAQAQGHATRTAAVSAAATQQAVWALANVAAGGEQYKAKVAAAGAIGPLVGLSRLHSTDGVAGAVPAGVQARAVEALWHLARGSEQVRAQLAAGGAIGALVEVLSHAAGSAGPDSNSDSNSPPGDSNAPTAELHMGTVKENAAGALLLLAIGSSARAARIIGAGAVKPLVALRSPGAGSSIRTQEHAAGILKVLRDCSTQVSVA